MSVASSLYPRELSPRDALEGAVKLVEGALQSDSSYSQLVDLFGAYGPIPSTSGLHDHDYPADPLRAAAPATVPGVSMRKIPLPPELTEQVSQAQTLCRLGLLPELGRAWLTVDSDLFVWLYETGGDLAYFDGLSEAILAVGMVAPRPGVFQRHVSALLCLATCSEIVILGISLQQGQAGSEGDAGGELSLLPEPLLTVSSDGVAMTCVGGTAGGRIFLGGRDGCLYEVLYSGAGGGWFGRRCRKVNHSSSVLSLLLPAFLTYPFAEEDPIAQLVVDDSRQVLYTRSEKGTLSVYDLGWPHGQGGCSRVISLPLATLAQLAARAAPTVEPDNFSTLVHIEALPLAESPQVHLVAVTQAGVRLYLTTSSFASPEARPSTLALLHVRLPPGFSTHAPPQRVRGVRTAFCRRGTTLLVAAHSDERDVLWMLSADAYPFQHCLMEASTLAPLDAGICCLAPVPSGSRAPQPRCQYAVGGAVLPSDPPAVVTQHLEGPPRVVLLSRSSCCVLESPRPVDTLRGLLQEPAGADAVRAFFALHGEVQASAVCLVLACNPADARLAERATQALFLHGGEPRLAQEPPPPPQLPQQASFLGAPGPVWASTPLHPGGGLGAGGRPSFGSPSFGSPLQAAQQQQAAAMGRSAFSGSPPGMPPLSAAPEVLFSGRHTGCHLYFSRLVRPLWTLNLVTPVTDPKTGAPTDQFVSAVPGQDLANYLQSIVAFRLFLERTSALLAGGMGGTAATAQGPNLSTRLESDSSKKAQAEAYARERASLGHLQRLVSLTAELLGLWKVLCDHQFRLVSTAFPPALRDQLRSATLRELLLADRQLPAALAAALVQTYLQDNATTEAVCQRLRSVCPSLYRQEDALFTQAHEKLLAARVERGQRRRALLDDAIALCKKVGPELLPLGTACGLLVGCGHPAGVVDLCLSLAHQADPQDLALHFYRHGEPPEDERGRRAHAARAECYRVILQMLSELRAAPSKAAASVPPLPAVSGSEGCEGGYEALLSLCLQSEDELWHGALYSWLQESGQGARLLEVRSAFLEAHLQRRCLAPGASPDQADLLWQYHERAGSFAQAARILARLADRPGPEVPLARRMEYLARAIVCLKGAPVSGPGQVSACEGDFLHQLEEKLEVARLQAQVREALLRRASSDGHARAAELAARLDAELVDVTRLYSDYADPCDLAECKLAIVRASGYDKPQLVDNLWRALLEREFRDDPRPAVLAQKLAGLAREYAPSERFFPLPFLVKFLELRGGQHGFPAGWVVEPLLDGGGVDAARLRDAYSDLYRGRDPVWAGRSLHLLQALARLVRLLLDGGLRQVAGGSAERRRLANRCLDDIPGYLVDLQSMPQEEAGVLPLIQEFKALQLRLEQYLQGPAH